MSTRSIIGTTTGTTFDGIYCHFDGYPSAMVPALAQIVTRDGAAALPILTGKEQRARGGATCSWESMAPDMPAPDTALDPRHPAAYSHLTTRGDDAMDHVVEGYGSVHLDSPMRFSGRVSDPAVNTGWCQWAYLFTEDLTLIVFEVDGGLAEVERFTRADLADLTAGSQSVTERVAQAECGEGYSRCPHYAWVHDPAVPRESHGLSMHEWLGVIQMDGSKAVAATVGGKTYELSGSGSLRNGRWLMSVKGSTEMLPVLYAAADYRGPIDGVELTYPPTKADVAARATA